MEANQCYVPHYVLEGTSREIGLQHGRILSKEIESNIVFYRTLFKQTDEWIADYCGAMQDRLIRLAPSLMEELAGIAEGAQQSLHWIIALNARTEIYTMSLNPTQNTNAIDGASQLGECTLLAVPEEGFLAYATMIFSFLFFSFYSCSVSFVVAP
jgi:hypothetical protein